MNIDIEVDTSEVDRDLARIAGGPTAATHARFAQVLTGQWVAVQAAIHVESGSLKSSATMSDPVSLEHHDWMSEIVVGGGGVPAAAFPGPARDPGRYAIYEFERGGAHDFLLSSGIHEMEDGYGDAIVEWMDGAGR